MNKFFCFLLLTCSLSTQADLITLDAHDYAWGTNISDVSEGVWVQQVEKKWLGSVTFSDVFSSAYTRCDYTPCDDFSIIGESTGNLSEIIDGKGRLIDGDRYQGSGLLARFDRPTNFVSVVSYAANDMTRIYAYDLLGNYLGFVQQHSAGGTAIGEAEGLTLYKTTVTFSSEITNIAYVIFGGNSAGTHIGSLTYSVPEPGSLALLAAGLVGIVTVRRQRRLR